MLYAEASFFLSMSKLPPHLKMRSLTIMKIK